MKTMIKCWAVALVVMLCAACQKDETGTDGNIGYLRLQMEVNTSVHQARADEVTYNPKQLAVQILDKDGKVVEETTNWTEWEGKQIALLAGAYTLKASSAGFDGKTSGFDKPYYAGSESFTIEKDKEENCTVTCTLANVKVTVNFDESFTEAFKTATVTVDDAAGDESISALDFVMNGENKSAYFPVTDLKATVNVTNKAGEAHSQTYDITGVQARDHYILTYKLGDPNGGNVNITVDPSTREYHYTFTISTTPKTTLKVSTPNAFSKMAYLSGEAITTETLASDKMYFVYRAKNAETWTDAPATSDATGWQATVTGLTPSTTYECRMVYGQNEYVSETVEFITESATALQNGSFDEWNKNGKPWFPGTAEEASAKNSWWDTGNVGTTISVMNKNPSSPEETEVHTKGGKSAKLQSQFVGMGSIGKFAAGNIYTGHFCSASITTMQAQIRFGRPFTDRPTQLKGWFKYTRGTTVDYIGNECPSSYKEELNEGDLCAIYIALTDNEGLTGETYGNTAFEINGDASADDPDNFIYKRTIDYSENNPYIIAYGSITEEEAKGTNGWEEFTIDLKYRDLTRKPKYIIVVASASKYGDFFTGSTNSLMYIDDFELSYDGEPAVEDE